MNAAIIQFLTGDGLHKFYAASLRGSLFAGFLTLSGFLFSAHTFIIVHMKKEMYDTESYKKRLAAIQILNGDHSYYGGLRRLSRLLITTTALALIASVLQLTLGLVEANWCAVVCLAAASVAIVLLVISLLVIALNLRTWFDDLEDASRQEPATKQGPTSPPVTIAK
jgi:hypothetical protein